ncbi:Aste57867_9451 [Aphanomyces stellatus]|uniref:Aste57867_9451 protein n=1 Tax=Aphanomyces stellatus TaxID=120398 RepID=A0A485KN82_9STRA|nr:hypothetical protein As57867_009415 [Aphanomyces stellatus]VFT86331.1 Aste57867_9451 [Aphanomyces stellatus]
MRLSPAALFAVGLQAHAFVLSLPQRLTDAPTCDVEIWSSTQTPNWPCTALCNQNIPDDPFGVVAHGCVRPGCQYQDTVEGGGTPCGNSCLPSISCNDDSPNVACDADTLTLSCAASGPTTCSALENDTDFDGHDIGSTEQPSAELCCDDCLANPSCVLYVWYDGTCYLKSAAGGQLRAPGRKASFVSWGKATPPTPAACDLEMWNSTQTPGWPCIALCNRKIPDDPMGVWAHGCKRPGCEYQETIPNGGTLCGDSCVSPITCANGAPVCDSTTLTLSCTA